MRDKKYIDTRIAATRDYFKSELNKYWRELNRIYDLYEGIDKTINKSLCEIIKRCDGFDERLNKHENHIREHCEYKG